MKNFLTLLFVSFLCVQLANCELRFVFSQFRHGARQPAHIHNGMDDFGERWDGPGELTEAGKRMHFLLGQRNRQYYKGFTTKSKIGGSVYIRSSDYNRTMESVQSQMQGFFPPGTAALINNKKTRDLAHPFINAPKGGWKIYDKMNMTTIKDRVETFPVHLWTSANPFHEFFFNAFACKAFLQIHKDNIAKPKIANFMKKFKAEYGERISKTNGKPIDALDNYWTLFHLFDAFISGMYDGRDMKKPLENGIDLKKFNATAFEFANMDIFDQWNGDDEGFFARWTVSILWPEVIMWMENRIAADKAGNKAEYNTYTLPRFAFFSTHDVTVGSCLTVLNRAFGFKKYYTPFATDLFFELHANDKNEYKVHVKYQSLTLGVVPFAEFKQKLEAQFITREKIAERCGFKPDPIFMH